MRTPPSPFAPGGGPRLYCRRHWNRKLLRDLLLMDAVGLVAGAALLAAGRPVTGVIAFALWSAIGTIGFMMQRR